MARFDLQVEGIQMLTMIKNASYFPYKTGKLKFHATIGTMWTPNVYRIHFDSTIAPYVTYLEEGTKPHNIPNAFGFESPGKKVRLKNGQIKFIPIPGFGVGGRFDGMFHPGSMKHKDFIKRDCVNSIVDYISKRWNGLVTVE